MVERYFRMDFAMEITEVDEQSGRVAVRLKPNPARYEWQDKDGKKYLYDKFDKLLIPEELFFKVLTEQAKNLPLNFQRQQIDSAVEYVNSRKQFIRDSLNTPPIQNISFTDKSDEYLNSLKTDRLEFAVLSIDVVGSTQLSTSIPPREYTQLIQTILFELSELVPKFNGHVLKYIGDALIAYFPAPSFIRMCDFAIDCAATMRLLVYNVINSVLREKGCEPIDIRIGIDAGEAYVVVVGSPETKQHKDIIGSVVNLATKIQGVAGAGGIALGDTAVKNLHVIWREVCEEIKNIEFGYTDREGNPYKIHRLIPRKKTK